MNKIWNAISVLFEGLFEIVEGIENTINYFYIGVIFIFLVVWMLKMIKHRKNNEEHASS
tara:strand:- start:27471 stop:27647 length:177 start_codon:yes stop_codon:yes gene_type:complete